MNLDELILFFIKQKKMLERLSKQRELQKTVLI